MKVVPKVERQNSTGGKYINTDLENGTDRSANCDFLFVILSNREPICYHFRNEWQFLSKIAIFPTTCI